MRVSNLALGLLASSAAVVQGKVELDDLNFDDIVAPGASEEKPAAVKAKVVHPQFTPLAVKEALFWEQFTDETASRWNSSNAKKAGDDEFSYVGKWSVEEPSVLPGFKGDKGLVVKSAAAHHAISAKLDVPLDNKGKTLVVQYEVKLQKGLECGGAYLKLLSEGAELHAEEFSNETPYQVMFGPDKCGSTNKVHFIIRRKNPNTGEYEEKHLTGPIPARLNKASNLYTLIVHENQDFEIRINGLTARAGNLLKPGTLSPSLNPPKEIEDPEDEKPEDWVDDEYIPDPELLEKPEDWDEDAPYKIVDPEASIPEDWDEEAEKFIADPDASIPDDWDEEEDGEWVAPEIPNPECEAHGCGPWKAPLIVNPEYKGKYVPPKIENPEYKGVWAPKLIPNPEYFEDATPSDLEPIGAIGFELWTMQPDILFDNIYLGHSVEEAEFVGNNTFVPKLAIESEEEKASAPKPPKDRSQYTGHWDHFKDDPVDYVVEVSRHFILNFSANPKETIINNPEISAAFAAAFIAAFSILFGLLSALVYVVKKAVSGGASTAPKSGKKPADAKVGDKTVDDKAEAKSTSTSSASNATKRSKPAN